MDSPFRRLISLIFEAAIILAVSGWLVKQAAHWVYEVRWILVIVAVLVVAVAIVRRIHRHLKDWRGDDEFF